MIVSILAILVIVIFTGWIITDFIFHYQAYKKDDHYVYHGSWYGDKPKIRTYFGEWFLLIFFVGFLYVFISFGIYIFTEGSDNFTHYEKDSEWTIYALDDSIGASGRFFLGSGRIDSDIYYYYVYNTVHGQKIGKLRASNVYLKYDDDNHYIEKYNRHYNDDLKTKLLVTQLFTKCEDSYYVIYIPEGSITNDFTVDLQ